MKKILLCVLILLVSVNVFAGNVDIEQPAKLADDNNESTTLDIKQGVYLWMNAAERGDADAQYLLGQSYYLGVGIEQDYEKAVYWFKQAAEQGNVEAQYLLGICYVDGSGVPQDYEEAVKWLTFAAEQNHAYAQAGLGYCYDEGYGVLKNNKLAYMWYTISLPHMSGASGLKELIIQLELNMTATEITEAEQMAAEWLEKHK